MEDVMQTLGSRRTRAGLALAVLLALGCGKNRVVLDIDVLSFMDAADATHDYDAPPLVPLAARLEPIAVQLLEGYDDLGVAQEATLDVAVRYDNQTGTGRGRIVIYFGPDAATVYATPPVATLDVDLVPGQATTGTVRIPADARVLDLFTSRSFQMGMDLEWQPSGSSALLGTCTLTQIQARVVSRLDLL
jgi:hypothetical protein